jgi:AraC-like DNA-binding protein
LIDRFALTVLPGSTSANLVVLQTRQARMPQRILLSPIEPLDLDPKSDAQAVFSATLEWGGRDNPLLDTLPGLVDIDIGQAPEMAMLAQLITAESEAQRCGVNGALNRLAEVLLIRILRYLIERGQSATGLLGGLADPRLSRAIVGIHQSPGRAWSNDQMAAEAGLSLSRFTELFHQRVGQTPQAYLRRWRMILARQDLQRGERVQQVAARYGYQSSEALGRAFQREFGLSPLQARL